MYQVYRREYWPALQLELSLTLDRCLCGKDLLREKSTGALQYRTLKTLTFLCIVEDFVRSFEFPFTKSLHIESAKKNSIKGIGRITSSSCGFICLRIDKKSEFKSDPRIDLELLIEYWGSSVAHCGLKLWLPLVGSLIVRLRSSQGCLIQGKGLRMSTPLGTTTKEKDPFNAKVESGVGDRLASGGGYLLLLVFYGPSRGVMGWGGAVWFCLGWWRSCIDTRVLILILLFHYTEHSPSWRPGYP